MELRAVWRDHHASSMKILCQTLAWGINMDSFITIVGFALIAAILSLILAQYKPEFSLIIIFAAGAGVLLLIVLAIIPALDTVNNLVSRAGIDNNYFKILLKTLGICYIAKFAADLCRDAGKTSMAGNIELAGRVAVVLLALPLVENLIGIIVTLIG
jgi:stage III sporulation protein AD